jgi:hypothetical protein
MLAFEETAPFDFVHAEVSTPQHFEAAHRQ